MKDGMNQGTDDRIAAHRLAADRHRDAMEELLALARAKGIDGKTVGDMLNRERAGHRPTEDVTLWAAIRKATTAYQDVATIAKDMTADELSESWRGRDIADLKVTQH